MYAEYKKKQISYIYGMARDLREDILCKRCLCTNVVN